MASVLPDHKLSKSKFLNWIKAALAVQFTKEEIAPVVQDEIEQFQRKCLQTIWARNGLPARSTCTTCNTENVIVCPTDRICNAKRKKCTYHRNKATQYRPSGCPNKICDHMKSEIQNAHRFHGPSYKNTDATKWCNNAWEIAKCYLPPDGYTNISSAAETDFNGIISVIINHKEFEAKIKDDLSKKGNIFEKGRDVGRNVRHSPNLEVEDTDLSKYITSLKDILNDPGFVAMNNSTNKAIQKLTKLENDDLIIGKDVVHTVLEDVGKTIQEQLQNEIDEYKYKTEKQKLELIDIVNLKVKDIEDKGDVLLTKLNETLKSCVDVFDARVHKSIQVIENQTEKGKQKLDTVANEGVEKITKEAENVIKEVQKAVEQRPSYNEVNAKMSEEIYQKRKEELKEDLMRFYKWSHSKVLLSPLFEEKDTPLASFYIRPELNVKTLQDMFKTEGVPYREIYLKADAGLGKTTFSKYLATSWYQAHCPDEKDLPYFEKEDLGCMCDFDFVFLVLLRDSNTSCSVDELIFKLIVSKLANSKWYTEEFLEKLMSRENCLVILDGLDEWTHPNRQCERGPLSIPHRNVRENCTILTTTRPWKLGDLNLSSYELRKTVELTKLSRNAADTLIRRTLLRLKSPPHNMHIQIDDDTFVEEIFNSRVSHLAYVPLLLMYMICLKSEGFNIGNSKCELYVKIVELLLLRTTQKYGDISQTLSSSDVPACFAEHAQCKEYFPLLMTLGQLAYHTLSNKTGEATLVFDGSVTEKYLKQEHMEFALHSGLLSQSKTDQESAKLKMSHGDAQKIFLEMPETKHIQLCLQDFFNDDATVNNEKLQHWLKQNKSNKKSLNIDTRKTSISLLETMHLFSLKNLSHIQKLHYRGDIEMEKEAQISLILFTSLQNLTLSWGKWTNDETNLIENLTRLQNLQYLCIEWFKLSHKILETIFQLTSGSKSIRELTLNWVFCKEHDRHDCKRLNLNLSKNISLKKLYLQWFSTLHLNIETPSLVEVTLWGITLDESSLLLSCEMTKIELVQLREIKMPAGSLQHFIIKLENLPQSVTVKMTAIEPEKEYKRVREIIRSSLTFHVIKDIHWDFVFKRNKKLSFSHKTVQEFFAAIFLSSHRDAREVVLERCRNIQGILAMSKICEFISGMNADRMCAISNDWMSMINEDEKTRFYRTRTGDENIIYNNPLYNIQKMFMSCLQEMPESENIELCLQDLFIDENTEDNEQLQRLLKQNKPKIKSLYIDIRCTSSSLREVINSFSLTDLSHIQKLYYCGGSKKEAEINRILFPSLQYVTLWEGTWTNDEKNVCVNLVLLQNVQYLYIELLKLSHKILEQVFNFISGQKSMKELKLHGLYCKEHDYDCKRLNLDLSQHSTLSKLVLQGLPWGLQLDMSTPSLVDVTLWHINLDESSLLLSRDMLNIKRVELWHIEMSAGSLQNFITLLENRPQSVTVDIRGIRPLREYRCVKGNIRSSQTFHVIHDCNDEDYGDSFVFETRKPSKE